MSENTDLPQFEAGDVLSFRGHEYRVKRADPDPMRDRVFQYSVEPLGNAPHANLKVEYDEGVFVYRPIYGVEPDDIEVTEG